MIDVTDTIFQIEGWLRVCDNFSPGTLQICRNTTLQQSMKPDWIPVYCILNRKTKKFHHFPSIESAEEFKMITETCIPAIHCLKLGAENIQKESLATPRDQNISGTGSRINSSTKSFTLDNKGPPQNYPNFNETENDRRKSNTGEKCQGSNTSINSDDATISKPQSNQSKFSSFFNRKSKQIRNIKRTKSATKLDRKKDTEGPVSGLQTKNQQTSNIWHTGSAVDSTNDFAESNLKRSASLGRLSKRLFSRTTFGHKSFDKKDKINCSSEKTSPPVPQLRPSHSSEALLSPRISANGKDLSNLDFIGDCGYSARSLHLSLSSEPCFIITQLVAPFGSIVNGNGAESGKIISGQGKVSSGVFKEVGVEGNQSVVCYACSNEEEKCSWLRWLWILKDCAEKCRTYNSLKLFILEAKNLPPKKRYFCEISLNKQLFARTTVKPMSDILFWGEQFCFNDLAKVDKVEISIYREAERKKKKEKHFYLGTLSIPTSEISTRQLNERWYPATIPAPPSTRSSLQRPVSVNSGKDTETILIRVKARFQSVNILPRYVYQPLLDCLKNDYGTIVEVLEPIVGVKAKEELATCLVLLLHHTGDVNRFLSDVVMSEVERQENDTLALRGNSIATKAIESYMVLIGQQYLISTLQNLLLSIITSGNDCEVDPTKVQSSSILQNNRQSLIQNCQTVWYKICNSSTAFPQELKKLFMTIREHYTAKSIMFSGTKLNPHAKNQSKLVRWDQLISSCVFLRFFCPAILSPSLFNIVQSFPDEKSARNLTLIAKTIQGLANFTKFGGKEAFMVFMNDFVLREFPEMTKFLESISVENSSQLSPSRIENDMGKELAVLHGLLAELIKDMSEPQKYKIPRLILAIQEINTFLNNPLLLNQPHISKPSAYPNTPPFIPISTLSTVSPLSTYHESHFASSDLTKIVNLSGGYSDTQKRKHSSPPTAILDKTPLAANSIQRYQSTENFISTISMPNHTEYNATLTSSNNNAQYSTHSNFSNFDKLKPLMDTYNGVGQQRCNSDIFIGFDQLSVDEQWKRIVACAESSKNAANLPLLDFTAPCKVNQQPTTQNATSVGQLDNKSFFVPPNSDVVGFNNEASRMKVSHNLDWMKIDVDSNRNVEGRGVQTNIQRINHTVNNNEFGRADVNRNFNEEIWQRNEMRRAETRNHNSAYERLMKMQKANSVESLDVPFRQNVQHSHVNYPRSPNRSNIDPSLKLIPITNSLQYTKKEKSTDCDSA